MTGMYVPAVCEVPVDHLVVMDEYNRCYYLTHYKTASKHACDLFAPECALLHRCTGMLAT